MSSINGNKAVKIPNTILNYELENQIMSQESFIYYGILTNCESGLAKLSETKNIDILEYQTLFSQRCAKYEKLFFSTIRAKMREKMYNDQIKDLSANYDQIYHPYNPYLQKYNGAYLRNYQQF
jgi:hypothetical protein